MWPGSDRASPQPPAGRAVPSLGPFAELLGQPYQRLKVAVLRQLAGLPEPSWSLAEAGHALTWLEPATANRLLSELRSDGLVVEVDRYGQPGGPPAWRLSDEGHLVATVCAVLAAPAIPAERANVDLVPSRLIRLVRHPAAIRRELAARDLGISEEDLAIDQGRKRVEVRKLLGGTGNGGRLDGLGAKELRAMNRSADEHGNEQNGDRKSRHWGPLWR